MAGAGRHNRAATHYRRQLAVKARIGQIIDDRMDAIFKQRHDSAVTHRGGAADGRVGVEFHAHPHRHRHRWATPHYGNGVIQRVGANRRLLVGRACAQHC